MKQLLSLLAIGLFSSQTLAADLGPKFGVWETELEAGAVISTGNTDQRNLKFKGITSMDGERFLHAGHLDILNSTKNGTKTAQKTYASYQADYKLEGDHAIFGRVAYEDDGFSGFDYQVDTSAGYNRQLYKTTDMNLKGAIGLGYRKTETNAGVSEGEVIIRLAADYKWVISESATFRQMLSTEIGDTSSITRSETSIASTIIGNVAMKVSLNIKHTSEVPAGRDKTDTETSMTLVYKF